MQVRLFRPSLAPSGHSQKYDPCVLVHSSEHPPLFILHSSTSRINISKIERVLKERVTPPPPSG